MQHKKAWWAIVIGSILLIIGYDLRNLWKNRARACEVALQNCKLDQVCSSPGFEQRARCLPLPATPELVFDLPFGSGKPVQCLRGNKDSHTHFTDYDIFAVDLKVSSPLKNAAALKDAANNDELFIYAAAEGTLFVHIDQESGKNIGTKSIRILHPGGYFSSYPRLSEVFISDGPVQAGQKIGRIDSEQSPGHEGLHFSIHYLNPQIAPEALRDSASVSLSIPFQFRFALQPKDQERIQILDSNRLPCGTETNARLFRADILQ